MKRSLPRKDGFAHRILCLRHLRLYWRWFRQLSGGQSPAYKRFRLQSRKLRWLLRNRRTAFRSVLFGESTPGCLPPANGKGVPDQCRNAAHIEWQGEKTVIPWFRFPSWWQRAANNRSFWRPTLLQDKLWPNFLCRLRNIPAEWSPRSHRNYLQGLPLQFLGCTQIWRSSRALISSMLTVSAYSRIPSMLKMFRSVIAGLSRCSQLFASESFRFSQPGLH